MEIYIVLLEVVDAHASFVQTGKGVIAVGTKLWAR